jgi:hypothetical protein
MTTPAEVAVAEPSARGPLPVARIGTDGRRHIDLRALLQLAAPLMLTNAIQAALNLTDTWFIVVCRPRRSPRSGRSTG